MFRVLVPISRDLIPILRDVVPIPEARLATRFFVLQGVPRAASFRVTSRSRVASPAERKRLYTLYN